MSHLLQMRGLKLLCNDYYLCHKVASFTDAWIETDIPISNLSKATVASFTDAWIETTERQGTFTKTKVASFTDAWIETCGEVR